MLAVENDHVDGLHAVVVTLLKVLDQEEHHETAMSAQKVNQVVRRCAVSSSTMIASVGRAVHAQWPKRPRVCAADARAPFEKPNNWP